MGGGDEGGSKAATGKAPEAEQWPRMVEGKYGTYLETSPRHYVLLQSPSSSPTRPWLHQREVWQRERGRMARARHLPARVPLARERVRMIAAQKQLRHHKSAARKGMARKAPWQGKISRTKPRESRRGRKAAAQRERNQGKAEREEQRQR